MPIRDEDVWDAADAIAARGEKPTYQNVRAELDGGSFSTIGPALGHWKARRAAGLSPDFEPIPSALADRLGEFGQRIWEVAVDAASMLLRAEREAIRRERDEIDAERREIGSWADGLDVALQTEREKSASQEAAVSKANLELESTRRQVATERARLADSEARREELQSRLDEALESAAKAREQSSGLRARLETLEAQNAELMARVSA